MVVMTTWLPRQAASAAGTAAQAMPADATADGHVGELSSELGVPNGLPGRLCSQRFYDDCYEMLQPGGMMVANLHYGHRQYDQHLGRIQRSFGGAMLVVDDSDLSNSIVFACKGTALEAARAGVVRRPKGLDRAASEQLLDAFSRVNRALRDRDEA